MHPSWWSPRDRVALVVALLLPLGVAALLAPFRASFTNTDAALVLVVAVVLVAANGHRVAGLVAAASAAVWFDFFLTAPYERFTIDRRGDVETTLLLVAVGAVVTELAVRGRRQRVLAQTEATYLDALASTMDVVNSDATPAALRQHVEAQLALLLGLRGCRFEPGRFGGLPRLEPDGRVRLPGGGTWDIDQFGLPDTELELIAGVGDRPYGRFVLTPVAGLVPPLVARRMSTILAGQYGAARARQSAPI